jgi:hypothetical protein
MEASLSRGRKAAAYLTIVALALGFLALTAAVTRSHSAPAAPGVRIVMLPVNGAPRVHSSLVTTWADAKIPTEDGAMLKNGCLTASYYVADVQSHDAKHAAETALAQVEGTTLTGWETGRVGTKVVATDFEHSTVAAAAPLTHRDFAVLVAMWRGCADRARVAEVATSIKSFAVDPSDIVKLDAR